MRLLSRLMHVNLAPFSEPPSPSDIGMKPWVISVPRKLTSKTKGILPAFFIDVIGHVHIPIPPLPLPARIRNLCIGNIDWTILER